MCSGVTRVGVTLFFLEKMTTFFALWTVMTFFSCRLLTTPVFSHRLSSVLFKFSHKKNNFIRVSPLDGVTRGGPPPPSDATANVCQHTFAVDACIFFCCKSKLLA